MATSKVNQRHDTRRHVEVAERCAADFEFLWKEGIIGGDAARKGSAEINTGLARLRSDLLGLERNP